MKSPGTLHSYPCVVFALRRESMYFRRAFPFHRQIPSAPCLAQLRGTPSQTILMVETGLGAQAMEKAIRWCLSGVTFEYEPYRPEFVLSLGFSGALFPTLEIGDLVLADEVIDLSGQKWNTICPDRTAEREQIRRGRLLMTTHLVGDPAEKRRLGQQFHAAAVDMESGVIARLCHEHGVPLACIRVISDDVNTYLNPHLVDLIQGGQVSPLRLAKTLMRHPGLVVELWRMANKTRWAARKLQKAAPILLALNREVNRVLR